MSYSKITEYEIVPVESFSVIRNCSGCGKKAHFTNTGKFRVNANGSKLDVWLIYQCENCKHTFNLTIFERRKVSSLPQAEYLCFLNNDKKTAEMYGRDIRLFRKNRAEIDFERLKYQFVRLPDHPEERASEDRIILTIHNPCECKIRPEKQIAGVWGISTSRVRKMLQDGELELWNVSPRSVSVRACQESFPWI